MWLQYDENLNDNRFLQEILNNHSDIVKKASEENWIICVPRSGVYESEISVDIILDHVLIHGLESSYCTLSKKQIVIKNKHIYTDTIYHQGGNEILFEELFYINKTSKYRVWCIDQPLFINYKYCDSHKSKTLEDLSDCIDFLWSESLGHGILNDIKVLVDKFVQKHQEFGAETVQTIKEFVGALYSQCLQIGLKMDVIREKSSNGKMFLDNFKLSVEMYMQYCLGNNLIIAVNTSQYQKDALINKLIRNSVDLELDDIGISYKFQDIIPIAKRELGKINNCNTILDKINCLKMTFNTISKHCENIQIQVTSDIILELLVYLILKLNINNWMSNIIFMKEFRLSLADNSDQCSFFITNIEAAIEFIKSNHFLDIKHSKYKRTSDSLAVELLSEKLLSGKLQSDLSFYLNSNNCETILCHPLCSCDKCQETLDNDNNIKSQVIVKNDENLLINSAKLGYCNVVEYLLKQRHYNVNSKDCFNKTCLHYAAAKGHQDILLLLIICNANVNATDNDKNTPLHLACMNGHDNCVKALIYSSPDVELNIGNNFGETPLHLATKWGYLDIIKILLESGGSLIIENNQKQTVISLASNYYTMKLFQHFGSHSSTKYFSEPDSNSYLKQENRVYLGHCKEHGVRPKDIEQYKKIDLLLRAIESNDFPLACFYLGFNNNSLNKSSGSVCHPLCRCEKCNSDQELETEACNNFCHTFNINICNVNGYTPLHIAAKYGRIDVLRLLLDLGALPNVKTYKTLYTPLHLACMHQRVRIVRELLNCGNCKVDECDAEGNTPLFYAVANNDVKTVEILVSNGADSSKKNYADKSPLQESEEKMFYRIFRILKISLTNVLERFTDSSNSFEGELF